MSAEGQGTSAESPAGAFEAYADQLIHAGFLMSRLRSGRGIDQKLRGMPVVLRELLAAGGELSPGELANRMGVSDARVANILRSLEERGLVTRAGATKDRRRVVVTITDAGRVAADKIRDEGVEMVAEFLKELGEEDAQDLVRVVNRVVEVMEARKREGRQVLMGSGTQGELRGE